MWIAGIATNNGWPVYTVNNMVLAYIDCRYKARSVDGNTHPLRACVYNTPMPIKEFRAGVIKPIRQLVITGTIGDCKKYICENLGLFYRYAVKIKRPLGEYKYSEETIAEIINFYLEHGYKLTAQKFDVPMTNVTRWMRKRGIPPKESNYSSPDFRQEVLEYFSKSSAKKTSEKYGVCPTTIYIWWRRYWVPKQIEIPMEILS